MTNPRVRDLVLRAASDPQFAEQLLTEPEAVAAEFDLGPEQIEQIKELAGSGLLRPAVEAHVISPTNPGGGGGGYY
jgi:hypothetical protein